MEGYHLFGGSLTTRKNKPQRNESIFHDINILCGTYFDLVNWGATNKMIECVIHIYKLWVYKHVSGFIGVNYILSKWMDVIYPGCT